MFLRLSVNYPRVGDVAFDVRSVAVRLGTVAVGALLDLFVREVRPSRACERERGLSFHDHRLASLVPI